MVPLVQGDTPALKVGKMHGIAFRALLRFRLPTDSLSAAAGGTSAADLHVESLRLDLARLPGHNVDWGLPAFEVPQAEWSESSTFVDTLSFTEVAFPSLSLEADSVYAPSDRRVRALLPVSLAEAASVGLSGVAEMDLLLVPRKAPDALTVLASSEATADSLRPRLTLGYTVGGVEYAYESPATEDVHWAARHDGGPPTDLLIVSAGIFHGSVLQFALPEDFPKAATVNRAQLELDIDEDDSHYGVMPFYTDVVGVNTETGDTTFTAPADQDRYHTFVNGAVTQEFWIDRTIVQGWVSGALPNHGLAIRPRLDDPEVDWVVVENPRLRVMYSLPPTTEN